jgi:hypothetical protein
MQIRFWVVGRERACIYRRYITIQKHDLITHNRMQVRSSAVGCRRHDWSQSTQSTRSTPNYNTPEAAKLQYTRSIDHKALITDHKALITDHKARITDHKALITDHKALITDHKALITDHKALITSTQFSRSTKTTNEVELVDGAWSTAVPCGSHKLCKICMIM